MKISSRPQTPIRMVSKKFRLLYPLEDKFNSYIEPDLGNNSDIETLQIFFDTDIVDEEYVKLLDLKWGVLQAETSMNWDAFLQLDFKEQQIWFLKKIHNVVIQVSEIYKLNAEVYHNAFHKLMGEIQ